MNNHINCSAEKDLSEIKAAVNEIKSAMLGNDYQPIGIIEQVQILKTKVELLQLMQNRVKWVALGFFLAGGGSSALLLNIFWG